MIIQSRAKLKVIFEKEKETIAVNYQVPWNLFANRKHHCRILNPGSSIVVLQEVLFCLQNIKFKQK